MYMRKTSRNFLKESATRDSPWSGLKSHNLLKLKFTLQDNSKTKLQKANMS